MTTNEFNNLIPSIQSFQKRIRIPFAASQEHIAEFNDIIYIQQGNVTYVINGIRYLLQAGNVAFISKGSLKQSYLETGDSVCLYTCLFTYSYFEGDFLPLPFPVVLSTKGDIELLKLLTQIHEIWTEKDERYLLRSRAVLMLALDKMFSYIEVPVNNPISENKHVRKIQKYIINHYHDKIRVDDLISLTGLHPVYISSLFRVCTGYTVKEYINLIRIQKAMDLLSSGEFKTGEVAYQCGFDDVLYFSKVFKKVAGMPPSTYLPWSKNEM